MSNTPLPPSMPSEAGSKFYFQGQKILLTYANMHIEKEPFIEFLSACIGYEPKFIRIAHETGLSTGVPFLHTHVLVDFGKRFQSRDCRRFDWNSGDGILHPNWRPIKSIAHWHNCTQYLAKEDPDNQDLLVKSCASNIWEAKTLQDALLTNCTTPGDALGVIALYGARPRAPPRCAEPNLPWQLEVLEHIRSPPNHRSIHWFYDPVGNTGKSWLARYLAISGLAYCVNQAGGSYHFATIIQSALASGWDGRCFVFDFPRGLEDLKIYGPIEEVKDGHVTAVKYQGSALWFEQPHVLVFANFLPKVESMSKDRWRIHRIREDRCLEEPLVPLATNSVANTTESADLTLKYSLPPGFAEITDNIKTISNEDLKEILNEFINSPK